jgi:ATP/ADP translocase
MAEDKNPSPVTRREFYLTTGTVYLLIGLLALSVAVKDAGWLLGSLVPWIVAIGAIIVSLTAIISALATKSPPKG